MLLHVLVAIPKGRSAIYSARESGLFQDHRPEKLGKAKEKELLGHKTLTMTLHYAHLAPSHKVQGHGDTGWHPEPKINYTKTIQFGGGCVE